MPAASKALQEELHKLKELREEEQLETDGVEGHLQDGYLETDGVEGDPQDGAEGEDVFGDNSMDHADVADIENDLEDLFENGNIPVEPSGPPSPSGLLDNDGDSDVSALWSKHVLFFDFPKVQNNGNPLNPTTYRPRHKFVFSICHISDSLPS